MKLVPYSMTRLFGRTVLRAKRNSPHIFFVGGVVGVVGSTVLACRSTLKLEDTLDDIKTDLEKVKVSANRNTQEGEREYTREMMRVYGKSGITLGRLYAPSIAVGVVSITALTGSHLQLTRRNTALTATLASVMKAYDEYRIRVQEEIGEERELDIYRATTKETIEEDGKKKVVKVTDPSGLSQYARFFDDKNVNWQKDPELNRIFLTCQQNYFNHRLNVFGHVFLNEVYDALGMERSSAGAIVGWYLDGDGDGYVDFGMFEPQNIKFINNMERSVILDFNVDGVIYEKIGDGK